MFYIASLLLPTQPQFASSDLMRVEPIGTWGDGKTRRKVGLLLLLTSVPFLNRGLGKREILRLIRKFKIKGICQSSSSFSD